MHWTTFKELKYTFRITTGQKSEGTCSRFRVCPGRFAQRCRIIPPLAGMSNALVQFYAWGDRCWSGYLPYKPPLDANVKEPFAPGSVMVSEYVLRGKAALKRAALSERNFDRWDLFVCCLSTKRTPSAYCRPRSTQRPLHSSRWWQSDQLCIPRWFGRRLRKPASLPTAELESA